MGETDHYLAAQRAAEDRLEALDEWMMEDTEGEAPEMLSIYCGCRTCVVREALHAAMPHIRQIVLDEQKHGFLQD